MELPELRQLAVARYVKACANHDTAESRRQLKIIREIDHNLPSRHETLVLATPSVHAHQR